MDPAILQLIEGLRKRLDLAESQLAVLSDKAAIPYERPGDGVSPEVRALVATGKRVDAMRQLRADTGLSAVDARDIIDKM